MASHCAFMGRFAGTVPLIVLLFWGLQALAGESVGPRMVLKESAFEEIEVREGQSIEREYTFYNQGDQPLEIKQVDPGCGCTVAFFDRVTPPGGEGKIKLLIDTKGLVGPMRENAVVSTNDPGRPQVILTLEALVKPVITLSKHFVSFRGRGDEILSEEVEIQTEMEKPLILKPIQFSLEGKVTYRLEELEKGRKYRLRFENIPGPSENYRGFLKLRTNYTEKPEITIWIWARLMKS